MPYSLIWEPFGVYKKFTGVVTGAELVRSVIEVAHDMKFAGMQYEVSDYLGAERTEFSQDALNEVRAVRIGSYSRNPRVRVAIVTLDLEIQQRIFSTIAARLTMHQTRIFDMLSDANAWVGRTTTEMV